VKVDKVVKVRQVVNARKAYERGECISRTGYALEGRSTREMVWRRDGREGSRAAKGMAAEPPEGGERRQQSEGNRDESWKERATKSRTTRESAEGNKVEDNKGCQQRATKSRTTRDVSRGQQGMSERKKRRKKRSQQTQQEKIKLQHSTKH
jgi:hypothetical protein